MSNEIDCRRDAIESFIEEVAIVKGKEGQIKIWVDHWSEEQEGTRDVIASSSFVKYNPHNISQNDPQLAGKILYIGRNYIIQIKIPWDGYLHLYNFGTSGTCKRIIPFHQENHYEQTGNIITIPSTKYFPDTTEIKVVPPTSKESGIPERLFAILTKSNIDLQLKDLNADLVERQEDYQAHSRGFSGPPRIDSPRLFNLKPNEWEYGMLEMFVF